MPRLVGAGKPSKILARLRDMSCMVVYPVQADHATNTPGPSPMIKFLFFVAQKRAVGQQMFQQRKFPGPA